MKPVLELYVHEVYVCVVRFLTTQNFKVKTVKNVSGEELYQLRESTCSPVKHNA